MNKNFLSKDAITEVCVSPVDADGWLGRLGSPMPLGEYRKIDLSSFGDRLCWFDVLIVDEDNEPYEYLDVDLCNSPPYIYFSPSLPPGARIGGGFVPISPIFADFRLQTLDSWSGKRM